MCAEACWQPKGLRTLSYWPQFIGLSSTKATRNITDVVKFWLAKRAHFQTRFEGPHRESSRCPGGPTCPWGGRKQK